MRVVLSDLLVKENVITVAQRDTALARQKIAGCRFGARDARQVVSGAGRGRCACRVCQKRPADRSAFRFRSPSIQQYIYLGRDRSRARRNGIAAVAIGRAGASHAGRLHEYGSAPDGQANRDRCGLGQATRHRQVLGCRSNGARTFPVRTNAAVDAAANDVVER